MPKQPKVFYGWWIVVASVIVMAYVPGVVIYGFTAFFEPIVKEFGWSYAQVSWGASLRGLEVGILAPLVGYLVDRWGTRKLLFGGIIIVATGVFSLSRIHSLGGYYASFVIISIGMSTCVGTVILPTLANWFKKKIGLAIGLVGIGGGLSGLLVPLVTMLIDKYEWRPALIIISISMLVVGIPLSLVIRHKPEPYGYAPDGEAGISPGKAVISKTIGVSQIPTSQVLKTRIFWQLAGVSMCYSIVTGSVMTHIMPYFTSVGISRTFSSTVVLVMALLSIGARIGAGWLGDRVNTKRVYIISFSLMAVGTLFFAYAVQGNMLLISLFILFYGIGSAGNITLRPVILRKYFPGAKFGSILGIADAAMMAGQAGAPLAGWFYDVGSGYRSIWLIYVGVIVIGVILLLTLPKPPKIPEANIKTADN